MTWATAGSSMFREYMKTMVTQAHTPVGAGLDGDTLKVALFNNTTAPDKDQALATAGYNASVSPWVTANEVTDTDGVSNWSAGGITLSGGAVTTPSSGVVMFDATDTTHSSTVTLANAYGCLVYNSSITGGTIANQGVSFHYFGGAQAVTTGTFTVVWHANGLFQITVA